MCVLMGLQYTDSHGAVRGPGHSLKPWIVRKGTPSIEVSGEAVGVISGVALASSEPRDSYAEKPNVTAFCSNARTNPVPYPGPHGGQDAIATATAPRIAFTKVRTRLGFE
jgi:hypothetical protein